MISYTSGEPMYSTSTVENIEPKLVVVRETDRKHVTKDDIERMERHGFVLLFVAYTNEVRIVDDSTTESQP